MVFSASNKVSKACSDVGIVVTQSDNALLVLLRQSIWFHKYIWPFFLIGSYFSKRTGGLAMRQIRCQNQTVAANIQGLNTVFMLIHTLVKPPFWWMPLEKR